jgi:hypothetical protein
MSNDQDGTNTSRGSVGRLRPGQIVDGLNMGVSSSKIIESSPLATTEVLRVELAVLRGNAHEDCFLTNNVDRSLPTRIASLSMQNRMQLLIRIAQTLQVPLSTSLEDNAICAENWPKLQELQESSGRTEKSDLTLKQFKTKLWRQLIQEFLARKKS